MGVTLEFGRKQSDGDLPSPEIPTKGSSTIQFPYVDFDQAFGVVQAIHELGGPSAKDQIAAKMSMKLTGAFSSKLSGARMFGLVTLNQGQYKISRLGYEILDGEDVRQKAAKVTAFLRIELYRRLYEEFKGQPLPPRPNGLEAAIERLGVTPKQKTDARYAFDRSARQCGFFEYGIDRLVAPVVPEYVEHDHEEREEVGSASPPNIQRFKVEQTDHGLDGVIAALVAKLPRGEGASMGGAERAAWLKMMAMAFDMAYGLLPGS